MSRIDDVKRNHSCAEFLKSADKYNFILMEISETLAMLYDKITVNEDKQRDGKDSWVDIDTYRLNTYKFP